MLTKNIKTYRFRIKDASSSCRLTAHSRKVNFVWNYCNEQSVRKLAASSKWLSSQDLDKLTSGCSKELNLHSQTIQAINKEYVTRRVQFKKAKLKWRSAKRSLGWIPFKASGVSLDGDSIIYQKKAYRFWKSQEIEGKIKTGSFCQDAMGRWYVNLVCEVSSKDGRLSTGKIVGIDLGLKMTAAYSYSEGKFEGGKHYKRLEDKLALAQRANKKKRIKAIHAKIANCRKDELHKETTRLVKNYDKIFVGDVSSSKLVKTKMAKSVLDAGWGTFRAMLEYKAMRLGVEYKEVKEMFSSVTCSDCFSRSGPSGLSDLEVRDWVCKDCRKHHDRDENAANNILMIGLGHQTLIKGISCLQA